MAAVLVGVAALLRYLLPKLGDPAAHWPLWDVNVYWWGARQAVHDAALYARGARYSFTYPPFAAALFGVAAYAPKLCLKLAITAVSVLSLLVLCRQALGAVGVRRAPRLVFAAAALALLTVPVSYTLHLGEIDLAVAALVAGDVLGRDGYRWRGAGVGLAAAVKLTPLIFVPFLALTGRMRAAAVACATFAASVAVGFVLLPGQSRTFWLEGVFADDSRVGNPVNPANQSLAGALARVAGSFAAARAWWLAAAALTAVGGVLVASWAQRRGHALAGAVCCGVTGLLVSPISWTHHWVWAVPLLVTLAATAWRRRSLWCWGATAATAVVFSGALRLPWAGRAPGVGRLLEGDLYVLCGLAALAGTALALALTRGQRRAESA